MTKSLTKNLRKLLSCLFNTAINMTSFYKKKLRYFILNIFKFSPKNY